VATDFAAESGMESSTEIAHRSPGDRSHVGQRSAAQRSRITNGRDLLPDIDGRGAVARRFRDIVSAILVDQGGVDQCSESRKQLIRRFAAAAVIAEQMESRLANGEQISITEHAQLASTLVRIAQRIEINRRANDITPALPDYLDAAETEVEARNAPHRKAEAEAAS
jgi:hypothetical protein